ncbi:EAL domain-containing protein [Caldibacillus lycopersici]|uniref:EAL domain-containing protein n=1 Tax=Perspicuibacillus lycopersici TaxID=1325689 RepID=A0AAE3IX22_9BACI|nr:bifunctional diguanylate cyclase/phosphodiesterase [Perspicuibacillus lycopersici]MCU9614961.1 EAL domain-containing protein [Perspicuibacillus lycopersici]
MDNQLENVRNKVDTLYPLFRMLSDGILVVDQLGIIIYMNTKAEMIFRKKIEDVIGKAISLLIPNLTSFFGNEMEQNMLGVRENQQLFPLFIQTQTLTIEDEKYTVILVKELIEAENNQKVDLLEGMANTLENIKFSVDEITIIDVADANGIISFVNQRFCSLSKYQSEELIGNSYQMLNSGYHEKAYFQDLWETIRKGEIWKGEICNRAKDGTLYWEETTIFPFMDADNKPYQYVAVRMDITERVLMEQHLQSKMQIDFVTTMMNLQNGIFKMEKNAKGNIVYTMSEGKLMADIAATSDVLLNHTPKDVFPKEIAELKQIHYEEAFKGNRANYEVELNGKHLYVDVIPIVKNNVVTEIVGTVHDISELRSIQQKLKINQQHYQSLFDHSPDYVIIYNKLGQIIDMNPKAMELFELTKETMGYYTYADFNTEENTKIYGSYFEMAVQGNPQNFEIELINQSVIGQDRFFTIIFFPIIIDEEIKGVYSVGKDISEQKRIQETNAYLAHHDELTDLPNRRWIEQKLNESLQEAKQKNHHLAVMFIDLDRFKYINDTLGHLIGDRFLEQIALRLLKSIDKEKQYAARLGGDEFMVLFPKLEDQKEPVTIARKLLENLANPIYVEQYELFVSASIGISTFPAGGTTAVDLMKKADIALYHAKEQGRNMYQIYSRSMDKRDYHSFLLERDLRKALLKDELVVHLQPRVNTKTGRIVGAEALVRWMHPQLGLIAPCEFIPLAEESGLIIPLGKWMKRKVCELLDNWRNRGIPLIPIGVNISSQRFLQKDFSKEVRSLLEEYQLDGKWLELEITENSIMKNEEYILETLRELKALGIKIYIDDFGTGYSSFHYLKTFKLDGIKIDQSFVQNLSCQSENAEITIAMIKMAKHLKMDVIAEGVETEEELAFLLEQNCFHVQGYLFGKPCAIDEFEKCYLTTV